MFEKDDKQLCTQINRLFNEALKRYTLVEDGDRILVGLSGGKDSMALLQLLALRSRIFKPRFNVEDSTWTQQGRHHPDGTNEPHVRRNLFDNAANDEDGQIRHDNHTSTMPHPRARFARVCRNTGISQTSKELPLRGCITPPRHERHYCTTRRNEPRVQLLVLPRYNERLETLSNLYNSIILI